MTATLLYNPFNNYVKYWHFIYDFIAMVASLHQLILKEETMTREKFTEKNKHCINDPYTVLPRSGQK